MKRSMWAALVVAALSASAASAAVPINNVKSFNRVFNDFTTSTLVSTNTGTINAGPGPAGSRATINDSNMTNDNVGGNTLNRHDFRLSVDGGATAYAFGIDDSYTFSTRVTLSAGSLGSPRKEAGIRLDGNPTGSALFIVNLDAGEIVAFGGGAPFKSFGTTAGGNGYVGGTSILMGITVTGGGDGPAPGGPNPTTIQYFIDRGMGLEITAPLPFSNTEKGPVNYTLGTYVQGGPNASVGAADFFSATFDDIRFTNIPEPATAGLGAAAFAGIALLRRRRSDVCGRIT